MNPISEIEALWPYRNYTEVEHEIRDLLHRTTHENYAYRKTRQLNYQKTTSEAHDRDHYAKAFRSVQRFA